MQITDLHVHIEHGDLAEDLRGMLVGCLVVFFDLLLPDALGYLGLRIHVEGVCVQQLHLRLPLLLLIHLVLVYLPAIAHSKRKFVILHVCKCARPCADL